MSTRGRKRTPAPEQSATKRDRNNGSSTAGRDHRGRFIKGNPGRPPGARHKATRAVEALLDGEAERLTRRAVELALAGDSGALRLCLERLAPPRREAPVAVDLPPIQSAADLPVAVAALLEAVAHGGLTVGEAERLARLVGEAGRALEVTDLDQRLRALEEKEKAR